LFQTQSHLFKAFEVFKFEKWKIRNSHFKYSFKLVCLKSLIYSTLDLYYIYSLDIGYINLVIKKKYRNFVATTPLFEAFIRAGGRLVKVEKIKLNNRN